MFSVPYDAAAAALNDLFPHAAVLWLLRRIVLHVSTTTGALQAVLHYRSRIGGVAATQLHFQSRLFSVTKQVYVLRRSVAMATYDDMMINSPAPNLSVSFKMEESIKR